MADYQEVYINKRRKFVRVGNVICDLRDKAFFDNFDYPMDFKEANDELLNYRLKFGDQRQVNALKVYQAITIWRENFE